ncbi:hypothetical protein G9A89_023173 [Geosiphon pyriformis]|nr:hypothetical protein G9A89_023173 [Geosiphon pyriformis]
MSKKKAPKGVFYGFTSGFFFQKKKVILGNIKHSDDERDISLSKSGSGDNVYSDVKSLSGDDEDVSMSGANINTGAVFGSPLHFSNFSIDDNKVVLPLHLPISLNKKWIDPKIIKTSMEMSIKKLFALDIDFLAIKEKLAMAKTQLVRKIFSSINGFGGATISSKFEEIIKSIFTSKKSMKIATLLAREKGINVNSDLKRQGIRSDQAVIIKEISINTPKYMIIAAVSEFGEIKSIKIQLIGMWQKAIMEFTELDQANLLASKWSFLIEKDFVHIAKAVRDHEIWALRDWFRVLLFTLPVKTIAHDFKTLLERAGKKTCIINRSIKTGNKIYCAMVGFDFDDDLKSAFYIEPIFGEVKLFWTRMNLVCCKKYGYFGHLALECDILDVFVLLLSKKLYKKIALKNVCFQLAKLYKKKHVPIFHSAVFNGKSWAQVVLLADSFGGAHFKSGSSFFFLNVSSLGGTLSPTSVNTSGINWVSALVKKLGSMELVSLATSSHALSTVVSVSLAPVLDSNMVLDKVLVLSTFLLSVGFNVVADFSSSSSKIVTTKMGGLKSKIVALETLVSLVLKRLNHLCSGLGLSSMNNSAKQKDIACWHKDIGNLISISIITETNVNSGYLNSGVAIIIDISLAHHTVNELFFVILGGNFNEDNSHKCASFQKCFDLELVNSLCNVSEVNEHFDMDYQTVSVSSNFKKATLANAAIFSVEFATAVKFSDLDIIFDGVFTKNFSRFHKLELLVSKIVKASHKESIVNFNLVNAGVSFDHVHSVLYDIKKFYYVFKLAKSLRVNETNIKSAIDKKMESFMINKSHTIRSVLEHLFHKVVLDHLIVNNKLILESDAVKSKVKSWTKKCDMYVFDKAFSGVMCSVEYDKLFGVISNLLDDKAAGLSGISNEL